MLVCSCPVGAAIPTITIVDCPRKFGQTQKLLFQRIYSSGTTKNSIADEATVLLLATWTALLAAEDGTKVQISPFVENPQNEPGEAKKTGGGNESLDGIEIIVGRGATMFTAQFNNKSQESIADIKDLMCENIGVYLIDNQGQIGYSLGSDDKAYPIPIHQMFVADLTLGGLEDNDYNLLEFAFKGNWSDTLRFAQATAFDPLTDLTNPSESS